MSGLLPLVDPDGLLEFSVVYTDRALNHMSQRFQGVMRDISALLKGVYNARSAIVVPGSGTFGMEAVARQFATGRKVLVIRNGWFSYRWTQICEMGGIPASSTVLKARQVGEGGTRAAFAPAPIDEVVAAIRAERPDIVFAPHVETSAGMILPDDYLKAVADAVHEVGGLFVLDCIASGAMWVDMKATGVDVVISAPSLARPSASLSEATNGPAFDPANPNAPPVYAPSTNAVPTAGVKFQTSNYTEVLSLSSLDRALTNTVLITILVVVGQVLTSIMGGYAFARIKFAGRDKLFLFYLGSIMIPFVVLLIPLYRLMVTIGWVNDLVSLVIPFVFTAYGTFLMRQFFVGIPKELEEAAVIDGASRWTILWKIFFPKDSLLDMGLRVKGLASHAWIYLLCLGVVIPAGVAHAIRCASPKDLIMVYGTSTVFAPENEGRIAHGIETPTMPEDWEAFWNQA